MHSTKLTRYLFAVSLALSFILVVSATSEAEEDVLALSSTHLIKLGIHDDSGKLLAQLILEEGQRGSLYFASGDEGLGIVPKVVDGEEVELHLFRVQRVADGKERAEPEDVLPPMARVHGRSAHNIDFAGAGKLRLTLLDLRDTAAGI